MRTLDTNVNAKQEQDNRSYPVRPIVGVGGLIFQGEAILLVQRGKEPGKGLWSIPGGAVVVGESLAQGVAREILEEVGLCVQVGPLVEVVERIIRDDNNGVAYHYVILDYLCRPLSGPMRPGSDAADARFVEPNDLTRYGLTKAALRVLEKARNLLSENQAFAVSEQPIT
jgi:ADP-ribose pyrophosphatase YjhB (NUDIX family)